MDTVNPTEQQQQQQQQQPQWPGVLAGLHHSARPTWKLAETLHFYRDVMGLKLLHAVSAKGWGIEGHGDFLHFFFDTGRGATIAFFYYLGTDRPASEVPRNDHYYTATHSAWQVETHEELIAWKAHLESQGVAVAPLTKHEVIESLYFADPNGYPVEITWQSRPFQTADAEDARRTLEAAVAAEQAAKAEGKRISQIEDVWRFKGAELEREAA
jgi:catechol 2,3-dioxygenase-like lactoylglutathione lyase family enzyme